MQAQHAGFAHNYYCGVLLANVHNAEDVWELMYFNVHCQNIKGTVNMTEIASAIFHHVNDVSGKLAVACLLKKISKQYWTLQTTDLRG